MNLKKKKKHLTQQRDAFKGKSERGLLDRKIIFETDLKKKIDLNNERNRNKSYNLYRINN